MSRPITPRVAVSVAAAVVGFLLLGAVGWPGGPASVAPTHDFGVLHVSAHDPLALPAHVRSRATSVLVQPLVAGHVGPATPPAHVALTAVLLLLLLLPPGRRALAARSRQSLRGRAPPSAA